MNNKFTIRKKLVLISSFLLCLTGIFAQSEKYSKITLERTEIRSLYSEIVGQKYELLISLPRSYKNNNSDYPVIFIADAYRVFPILKGTVDVFTSPGRSIPEVILVGIGYGGDEASAMAKWAAGRTRDLTPAQDSTTEINMENAIKSLGFEAMDVQTGGAPLFLDFIRNELFPFINSNYRIDNKNKVFYGYSFGGLFGLYTLFHAPDTFNKYLIGSPSIHYKNNLTFEYENDYAKNHSDLKAKIFMSSGGLEVETSVNINKMEKLLRSRIYPQLKLETVIFENEDHTSCAPAAVSRGLIELFNNK